VVLKHFPGQHDQKDHGGGGGGDGGAEPRKSEMLVRADGSLLDLSKLTPKQRESILDIHEREMEKAEKDKARRMFAQVGPKKGPEEDYMDIVQKVADELFGEVKAAPPWAKEQPPEAAAAPAPEADGKVNPDEAAKAARDAAQAQNDQVKTEAGAAKAEGAPADQGQVPGGDPTEADPALAGILDDLAKGLLAEIQPLKQGGDPTQVATGLKAALEKFAAAFMQTYVVPAAQAAPAGAVPPAAAPAAAPGAPPPAAKLAAPVASPPGQAPQAAPAAPPAASGAAPQGPPFPPKKKSLDIPELGISLDEEELRATIQKVIRQNIDEARMHLTGRLPG
jgi:hypothetical protein